MNLLQITCITISMCLCVNMHGRVCLYACFCWKVCKLEEILSSSSEKSIQGLSHLTLTDLYQKEPNLSRKAQGALWIPEETILDPFIYGILLAHHARKNGGQVSDYSALRVNSHVCTLLIVFSRVRCPCT